MAQIKKFTFSPFAENTYVVSEGNDCIIIDPGCYAPEEEQTLKAYVEQNDLNPIMLFNTHCHLDHVFGNNFVYQTFGLKPVYHQADEATMKLAPISAQMYGVPGFKPSPKALRHIDETEKIVVGKTEFELRFAPGHAPGHLVLIDHKSQIVIGGDVLFRESIGRTDLPGGNHQQLIDSIRSQLMTLDDDFLVYSGHGPETTIGHERSNNPFF